ncbi:2-oxoacid dehydrogenases acyltransferase-domain-containing protein [Lentinula edodes]|nr:2-oxoacid dehydrogenases acyltransferase-domain-containing protein [Lentinula edodes]
MEKQEAVRLAKQADPLGDRTIGSRERWKLIEKFKLADIGEGITESEIVKWLGRRLPQRTDIENTPTNVKPQAVIQAFDPFCEAQSDKANVEITSHFDGVVTELLVQEGQMAKVGSNLCLIEVVKEAVIGISPNEFTSAPRRKHPMDLTFTPYAKSNSPIFTTPSVRHFARQRGIDFAQLTPGSGKDGRIEKPDIDNYLAGAATPEAPVGLQDNQDVVVELGRTRHTLNANIPLHFLPPSAITTLPLAVSPSSVYPPPPPPEIPPLGQYMATNPSLKPTSTIRRHSDISVALSTPNGVYMPIIQSADSHSMYALSSQLKYLSHLDRQIPCGLTPKEMPKGGATLTVSNVGAIGAGDFTAPVLVPRGWVAIVALRRAQWVWDVDRGDGSGERRLKVVVSWSADHRVIEGAELAAFVECWRSYVDNPARLIAVN